MRRPLFTLILAVGLAGSLHLAHAAPEKAPFEAKLIVAKIVNPGTDDEMAIEAEAAGPGDILEYRGTYSNVSAEPLSGLVINGPIPANTGYYPSATEASVPAAFQVLVKDEDWQGVPAYKTIVLEDGTEKRVEAQPSDYLQIRWKLAEPLAPSTTVTTQYRVRVHQ